MTRLSLPALLLAALSMFIVTSCGGNQATRLPDLDLDLNLDYRELDSVQRARLTGLNDAERAALRLWTRQVLATGMNNGGIYFNVLNNPQDFSEAEVDIVRSLYNEEMAGHGGVNGKELDQLFFAAVLKITSEDIATDYATAPAVFADGPINLDNIVTGSNGLGSFSNAVIRLWVHDLLDNGAMDGSITKFTLLSSVALDAVDGSPGALDPENIKVLLAADLASGAPDGTPLRLAFSEVLDAVYLDGAGTSISRVLSRAGIDQAKADALFAEWSKRRDYTP